MSLTNPDKEDLRRAVRTLVQSLWAWLATLLLLFGFDVPAELPEAVLFVLVPPLALLISWISNEWEDAGHPLKRKIARLLSGMAR